MNSVQARRPAGNDASPGQRATDPDPHRVPHLVSLDGRRAVVTGAARGIGLAIAGRLSEAGAAVAIADTDGDGAVRAAAQLAHGEHAAIGVAMDVTDLASIRLAADSIATDLGGIDIWVNNAGIYPVSPALETTPDEWDAVLNVNLRGAFFGAQTAAGHMIRQGSGGVIVNIVSLSGHRAVYAGLAAYAASKHGLRGLTQNLALEFGPHNIRVLAVSPGYIATDTRRAVTDPGATEAAERTLAAQPLQRVGVPDDIACAVVFCASDLARHMTGCTLPVDGGILVR